MWVFYPLLGLFTFYVWLDARQLYLKHIELFIFKFGKTTVTSVINQQEKKLTDDWYRLNNQMVERHSGFSWRACPFRGRYVFLNNLNEWLLKPNPLIRKIHFLLGAPGILELTPMNIIFLTFVKAELIEDEVIDRAYSADPGKSSLG